MTGNNLQLSGLAESTQTTPPASPDSPLRPVRAWTLRMSQALGLPRRRIQKLLADRAPDATDDVAAATWSDFELSWRRWIQAHPRYRSLSRRLRSNPDFDAQNAGSAAAGAKPDAGIDDLDPVKRRKCILLDLQIGRERGQLVARQAAKDVLTQTLHLAMGRIDEIPALIAQQLPIDQRDAARKAGTAVAQIERRRFESDIRKLWSDRMPALDRSATSEAKP